MSVKVNVKWGKEIFKDVEIDYAQPPVVFKTQIFSMSGVPIDRQKVMAKGKMLKDDDPWDKFKLKDGMTLMLMGSAEEVPEAPKVEMKFVEDLPEEAQDYSDTRALGNGLNNIGNTCYMNSTIQCLYNIPDLKDQLNTYAPGSSSMGNEANERLTLATKDLFGQLTTSLTPVTPMRFHGTLTQQFPQFGQRGNDGSLQQQDAEECFSQVVYAMSQALRNNKVGEVSDPMKDILGCSTTTTLKCEESGETFSDSQTLFTLKCNITSSVNHLEEGIRIAMQEDREKYSDALGRNAVFQGTSKVSSLPKYICVQFVRFFWKTNVSMADGVTGVKSKILRKVTYPMLLDMETFCDDKLKGELEVVRSEMKRRDDLKFRAKAKDEGDEKAAEASSGDAAAAAASAGDDVDMQEGDAAADASDDSFAGKLTGHYDLVAVLTHKGRSGDSGHYISYVKRPDDSWVSYDDANPSVKKEEEIKNLSGGGDHHMAYLCFYKAKTL
mmetsp:Transcript_38551/g.46608  ORF Transcript_38551/g.46608 Transcript_38551/m.46608 type:complete len:495 (+) Transcript_38551:208-1692(+)|eukprot:CAMPEP_0197857156 /NCGR_PEP_ID=MMETSP1438-20131217/29953_1 /TAXON_ID=1461541 /ORGANISM="Pterosperma sp., Strain CCMP1384" /LENGTH=494 /DNA_ID=CAMNT_0043472885 /DNA_START=204 /DNA_END=1688 /DNA_ORIENTATION=+